MAPKRGRSSDDVGSSPAKRGRGAGGAAKGRSVDSKVPNAAGMTVVEDYTVTLNQTNIGANNNKFYIIQVLEGAGKFYAWNRWGRVGEDGASKLAPCGSKDAAVKDHEKKFREKTKNAWADRENFKPAAGKYTIVETEDSGGAGEQSPMGKLTEAQIKKGSKVLDELKAALKGGKKNADKIIELSSKFYTVIPTDVGRKVPPPINSQELCDAKDELLKFFLRMGFDEIDKKDVSPISGIMELPLPKSLKEACTGVCSPGSIKPSEDKGIELAKKQAGKPKQKMDSSLYGAIMLYTSNVIYTQLNAALRDSKRGSVKKVLQVPPAAVRGDGRVAGAEM